MRLVPGLAFGLFASLSFVACSATDKPATLGGVLSMSSPADNSTVSNPADGKIPVSFATNYTLKPFGQCDGQDGCGSVFLLIDNTNCDAANEKYNALAVSSPTSVDLTLCSMALGTHTITAELHQDNADQSFVDDPVTKDAVTTTHTITVVAAQ